MDNRTFKLEELDEKFWEKVILITKWNSSSMGGPGCLWLVTLDKKLYYIGFEGFPYAERNLGAFTPLLKRKEIVEDYKHPYEVDGNGWQYLYEHGTLIRDDFYGDFMRVFDDLQFRGTLGWKHDHMPAIAGLALGLNGEPERYNEETTYKRWLEREQWMQELDNKRQAVALTKDDFVWKELHANNNPENMFLLGEYAMIFKECDEKTVGYRFTIMYQREEISPLFYASSNSKIERYNLFEWRYDDVMGPLSHKDSEYDVMYRHAFDWPTNTLHDCDLNTPGRFIRSFATAEKARLYALEITNLRHYVDKESIIRDLDNKGRIYRNLLRKYEALLVFREHYEDILRIVCNYEYREKCSSGGAYIADAIRGEIGIDKDMLSEMWDYIPFVLSGGTQEKAEAIVRECKEYFMNRKHGESGIEHLGDG